MSTVHRIVWIGLAVRWQVEARLRLVPLGTFLSVVRHPPPRRHLASSKTMANRLINKTVAQDKDGWRIPMLERLHPEVAQTALEGRKSALQPEPTPSTRHHLLS